AGRTVLQCRRKPFTVRPIRAGVNAIAGPTPAAGREPSGDRVSLHHARPIRSPALPVRPERHALMPGEIFGFDAFSPHEVAGRIEHIGVAKARLPLRSMFMLSLLAGAFIGLGSIAYLLVVADPT